jgi:hypothetical protein
MNLNKIEQTKMTNQSFSDLLFDFFTYWLVLSSKMIYCSVFQFIYRFSKKKSILFTKNRSYDKTESDRFYQERKYWSVFVDKRIPGCHWSTWLIILFYLCCDGRSLRDTTALRHDRHAIDWSIIGSCHWPQCLFFIGFLHKQRNVLRPHTPPLGIPYQLI